MIDWFAAVNIPTVLVSVSLAVFCTEAVRRVGRFVVGLVRGKDAAQ